jgi:N-ethylmaleimide reductase
MVLANPDFVERLKTHAALNAAVQATFYGGTAIGYTDYPALSAQKRSQVNPQTPVVQ